MNSKRSNKVFSSLFAFSSILLAVAFFTISNSFSLPSAKTAYNDWDVHFSEPITQGAEGKTIVANDKIDIRVSLKNSGEAYQVFTNISNDGDVNARITDISMTNLANMKVGTSDVTGRTYYYSDYVSFTANYLSNNQVNNIIVDTPIKVGDVINRKTNNEVLITVKYKDFDRLTDDQIEVLKSNIEMVDNYYVINLNLNVQLKMADK